MGSGFDGWGCRKLWTREVSSAASDAHPGRRMVLVKAENQAERKDAAADRSRR